ncbi:MAG: hypothetical protein ACREA0_09085, partial [bacterium]
MTLVRHVLDLAGFVLLMAGPVPACVYLARNSRVLPQVSRGLHSALVFLLAWFVLQVNVALLLGILGLLRWRLLVLAEIVLFAAALPLRHRTDWDPSQRPGPVDLTRPHAVVIACLASFVTITLWNVAIGPMRNRDSLAYHLPAMATFYQTGSLATLDHFGQIARYPYDWEVLSALFLFPFGEDFLVALPNVLALLALACAISATSQAFGAERTAALTLGTIFAALPGVLRHVGTMRVDLQFAASFMAAVYLAVAWRSSRGALSGAIAVAALALMPGIKMTGVGYAPLVALWGLLAARAVPACREDGERTEAPPGRSLCVGLAGAGAALLAGGYWYANNYRVTGNPFG